MVGTRKQPVRPPRCIQRSTVSTSNWDRTSVGKPRLACMKTGL